MEPEQKARKNIDQLLEAAGWKVQAYRELNLGVSLGVAVCDFPLKSGTADYLLFVNRRAIGGDGEDSGGRRISGSGSGLTKTKPFTWQPISHSTSSLPFSLSKSASLAHPAFCFGRQASTVTVGWSPRAFASLRSLLTSWRSSLLEVLLTQMTRMAPRPIATIYGSSRTTYCLSSIIRLNFCLSS